MLRLKADAARAAILAEAERLEAGEDLDDDDDEDDAEGEAEA